MADMIMRPRNKHLGGYLASGDENGGDLYSTWRTLLVKSICRMNSSASRHTDDPDQRFSKSLLNTRDLSSAHELI